MNSFMRFTFIGVCNLRGWLLYSVMFDFVLLDAAVLSDILANILKCLVLHLQILSKGCLDLDVPLRLL